MFEEMMKGGDNMQYGHNKLEFGEMAKQRPRESEKKAFEHKPYSVGKEENNLTHYDSLEEYYAAKYKIPKGGKDNV